jgi:ABC-type dipeptide/oligopeptide/nickel transport system permease subunit
MATRRQKLSFAKKRLIGFWNQFKRSKRGIVGMAIIVFFCLVAIFAPYIAPYRPINPQMDVGDYPINGPARGEQIASRLSKPAWYTYLPWIHRGQTELKERFYNLIKYYPEVGQTLQTFGSEGQKAASDDSLILSSRVTNITSVEALYFNGTVQEMYPNGTAQRIYPNGTTEKMSPAEYFYVYSYRPREVRLKDYYENDTTFVVDYYTGTDLVSNTEVVEDHWFDSNQSLNEWNSGTWKSNYPDLTSVSYNTEEGFSYTASSTANLGCMQISYQPKNSISLEPVEVTVSRQFTYPYNQPPESFLIPISLKVEGTPYANVSVLFSTFRENETKVFLVASERINSTSQYTNIELSSLDPQIAQNVGLDPPQDRIFASPGKFNFSIQVVFPPNTPGKVYVDDVNCLVYGNVFGIMGTDNSLPYPGDIFSLLVYGSRVSLVVGILTAVLSTLIGLFLGLASGYIGGLLDEGIMRFADLLLVLPTLPLFIVLMEALRTTGVAVSMWNIIIILTFFGWMSFARSVRSMVLSIRERAFIEAAKASGAGKLHIINRHIIPNVFALVYITLAMAVPGAIITEASLSWLGLGDPTLASWGKILYDFNVSGVAVTAGLTEYWFWIFPACIAIMILALAFVLVGFALDEILNPRLRERR